MLSPRTLLLVLLLCPLLLTACGGGGGGGEPPATEPAPRASTTAGAAPAQPPRSLDPSVQRLARRALGGRHGSVVAIEVPSGRVMALAGSGGGDPTRELIAPGSTLKTLLAGAALEAGIVDADGPLDGDTPPVPGAENYGGARLGPLTVGEALASSSNTAFARIAIDLGPQRIEAALRRGGWGRPAAIDLPRQRRAVSAAEVAPLVDAAGNYHDPDVHQRSTVLQLALLAAAVAGDGRVPRASIAAAGPATVGRLWSAALARELRRGLRLAVTDGTGTEMLDPELEIAGKTGTIRRPDGRIQASTIAFAPYRRPAVALAVSLVAPAEATGGTAAAPVARTVLRALTR
jgi:peptidoglycan glycosyltransferase